MALKKIVLTPQMALQRARKYCAYQERSQQEVRDKLYSLGLHKKDVEQQIAVLIEEGFLNEQRFAIAFAGGKFRISNWGRIKISLALKNKKVSDYCIRHALRQIDEHDYKKVLSKILERKRKQLKERDAFKLNYQLAQYAMSRGFEKDIVWELLDN
jgi:regulatory protein